ncbi:MAG: cation transporter, partial [Mariprofundaceae bacterium]|nr:cation transporter [Mariprofundaceae bacterium]
MNAFPYATPYIFAGTIEEGAAETQRIVLDVQGMTCGACVITVERSLSSLDGVS